MKIMKTIAMLVGVVALIAFAMNKQSGHAQGPGTDESKIRRGLEIAPVPLDISEKNPALVGLGSYIVNAQADCNGCHTVNLNPYLPGHNPFLGQPEIIDPDKYLVGGSAFGPFVSRNLRPRSDNGRPAGLTFEQFETVMRTGADLKHLPPFVPSPGNDLLQVMAWPSFKDLTNRDIEAIYEYLRALPPHSGFPE
ncbi:MAG TPA: hypothetical protein VFH15_10190 [Pyrinomonadaceae bacterium]|nr:hypothetical protein [Pyrinomonadaceae bacterium]